MALAQKLMKEDPQLAGIDAARFGSLATEESIKKTKAALESKSHKVTVVKDAAEALAFLKKEIPAGVSVNMAGSTTLSEIGFVDYLKEATHPWRNLHAEILAEKDMAKQTDLRRRFNVCDYFVSSVTAVAETGEFTVCCLSGSRCGPFTHAAGKIIVVVGAQKIVKDYNEAVERTEKYCLPIESARVRIAYKIPASSINNFLAIRGGNPFGPPGRFHVIIVKESLGF